MITVNFSKVMRGMKPMHGVGQPPFIYSDFSLFRYLKEAGIPYSRLHDVGGWLGGGLYVDIPNLFRDFSADENDPDNYDFAFTDRVLVNLIDNQVEPFFRLGVSIENSHDLKTYRIFPPTDYAKWARICEHVIRHYNEGWANGYHMGITYWEIWNEPDGAADPIHSCMWCGTPEQYYELYDVASKHLKKCFGDSIQIGGYASCGFYASSYDPKANGQYVLPDNPDQRKLHFLKFFHGFLQYVRDHESPMDYFSWHSYEQVPEAVESAQYCRRVLNHYGFNDVPDILNEWNPEHSLETKGTQMAAAKALSFMIAMQDQTVAEMNYYDARLEAGEYAGLFNPATWTPYPAYYSFRLFNDAYRLKNETQAISDDPEVYCLSAANEKAQIILIANHSENSKTIDLDAKGTQGQAALIRLDNDHLYEQTDENLNNTIKLPPYGCIEIRYTL